MTQVIIGVDPHKLSATIEVVNPHEKFLGSGRFTTDQAGYTAMRKYVKSWPDRVWAVEGANGAGRPLAQRLLEAGEHVVDVPAKLAARVRLFDTGHNRKTDARDAHSIAVVAVRTPGLRILKADGELEALRMLTDRREALTRRRVQTVNRLQALLAELLPGQAKRDITALQAKKMLASVRPRDIAGKTRRRIAAEELSELTAIDAKIKTAAAELKALVLDASSGEQNRHRLSRAGNRRMNHMIHIAAVTQLRLNGAGRAYYRRKRAAHKKPMEAMRCLKRRISDAIYRQLLADAARAAGADPGGHCGASQESSAVDLPPHIDTSDQPLPGPAGATLPGTPALAHPRAASAPRSARRRAGAVKVERPTGRTTLTATSAGAPSAAPKPHS
jgi:transposase